MRNLSPDALIKIASKYGNEPIIIIGVQWNIDGDIVYYADRDTSTIPGRILEVSNLDNVVNISNSMDSQEINITLDDTDSVIKELMDTYDIHKRDVWIYQWFEGLALGDKFLLFRGKINTPVIWKEGEQTVSFSVVSQLEDKEIGFSPEEGQFPYIPNDLIGKPWPMIFGTAVDVPAVQISQAIRGTILQGVGIISGQDIHQNEPVDGGTPPDMAMLNKQLQHVSLCADYWRGVDDKQHNLFWDQASELRDQKGKSMAAYNTSITKAKAKRTSTIYNANSKGLGTSAAKVLGGEDFPRGTQTFEIGDGKFTGQFRDDIFYISSRINPKEEARLKAEHRWEWTGGSEGQYKPNQNYHYTSKIPDKTAFSIGVKNYHTKGFIVYGAVACGAKTPTLKYMGSGAKHSWYDAGSEITFAAPITYIASIIPGEVLSVKAFKDFDGVKKLIDLPDNNYTIETVTYGTIETVQIKVVKSLSTIEGQKWAGDDIYVTFQSTIGPNIVDILEYLINTYTDFTIDNTSFDEVKLDLTPFPANFAYLDRKNIVTVLEEIAFQARCNIRLKDGKFYLSYLAKEPITVDTITESDIENQSIEVSLTSTEDIITKYTATWRISYAQDDLNKIILRHNVKKYGIQEEEYEYYIYNQPDIIQKVATFWLIRKANSWKQIRFNTFLNKLNLETFDSVLLDFNKTYVASGDVKVLIQQADFNSENQTISMECWVPIKAGDMEPYGFAWPSQVDATLIFPTDHEVDLGLAGGDGIGAGATGDLPIGYTPEIDQGIFIGGPNIGWGPQSDRGAKNPSDIGFSAQDLRIPKVTGQLVIQANPDPNLLLNYAPQIPDPELPPLPPDEFMISLEGTKVVSGECPNIYRYFSDILKIDETEKKLCIKTSALFSGADGEEKHTNTFDFKYDTEGEKWGAGTAFLQD